MRTRLDDWRLSPDPHDRALRYTDAGIQLTRNGSNDAVIQVCLMGATLTNAPYSGSSVRAIDAFVEKPDPATAAGYAVTERQLRERVRCRFLMRLEIGLPFVGIQGRFVRRA
jgi:hypothetical protein